MDEFVIDGGRRLRGTTRINGSKNAGLPILIATLLTDDPCIIDNVPRLRDIRTTVRLLETLGKKVVWSKKKVTITHAKQLSTHAPYDIVKQMRASILVAGPLLARFNKVRVSLPGGCAIGLRPVDIHVVGLEAMGAKSTTTEGDIVLNGQLKPSKVKFRFPSVGATENIMMAAAAIEGKTVITNAAREPEIEDLADFLNSLGARVTGAGSSKITVEGKQKLHGAKHKVIADRIETGTLLLAVAAAGGDVILKDARTEHLTALIKALKKAGAKITPTKNGLRVQASGRPKAVSVTTEPHPGFPTDVQAPYMAYMSIAKGEARIREAIFERRFLHAAELARMGARVAVSGDAAFITGVENLSGAAVMASDIRAGAGLIVAALAAKGRTVIGRVYHIDRGYEQIEKVLRKLGANIRRLR
ncbi:MAG: UDP-N-acetylglucosamine 1-carboxyvinyltransferase [Elusimicrobia bacterium]|nr:UDP-N-acetylglucosamine 1-carboxyvinyltransferase [Elusimicrobiota bacterium]